MKRRDLLSATAVLSATSSLAGVVQAGNNKGVQSLSAPWPVRGSEAFAFHSKHVGDSLAVGVWQPPALFLEMAQAEGKPLNLVYLVDGSFALGQVANIAQLQYADQLKPGFPPLILVGVDYLEDKPNARTRDYTHTDLAVPLTPGETPPENTIGGADNFLRFLEQELDPMIRSKYNVSDKPAGIVGDLRLPPPNRLEALKGDRRGQYSIRVNDQWRICFVWSAGHALRVEIVDYH